jgi:choline monooxygenase
MIARELIDRMKRPLSEAAPLPGLSYGDPAVMAKEMDRVFRSRWVSVGFGQQVPGPGDVLPIRIGGHPLIVVRGHDDQVRVFHNVCRHRGLLLVEAPCAAVTSLACPYHGWTYAPDGRCTGIPYWDRADMKPLRPAPEQGYGLLEVPSRTWLDLVFVDLHGNAPPFEQAIRPIETRWNASGLAPRTWLATWEADVAVNWKLVIENFMDAYHLPFVHPQVGTAASAARHEIVRLTEDIFGARYLHAAVDRAWSRPLPPIGGLPAVLDDHAESFFVFPNTLLFAYPSFMALRTILPIGPTLTREVEHLYVSTDAMADGFEEQRTRMKEASRLINDQDLPILARLQATRASAAVDTGRFAPSWDGRARMFQVRIAEALVE